MSLSKMIVPRSANENGAQLFSFRLVSGLSKNRPMLVVLTKEAFIMFSGLLDGKTAYVVISYYECGMVC